LHCGTLWRYGPSHKLPISETASTAPVGEYGIQKDRIARMLKEETASGGLVTTSLHPGHIVGPGWHPINPVGNYDPAVWATLSAGRPLRIPGIGVELMHHVHADDVAQAFERAIEHRDAAAGEDFNVVAPTALNVRGYAHTAAGWFGQTASLEPVTWEQFRQTTTPEHAEKSWDHLYRSHCLTIEKAKALLGYAPRYEPETAVLESVCWLIEHDELRVARPLIA
jgi:nucleoside-diphosphate-sugar epimerase